MIKTLDFLIEHEQIKGEFLPVNLEMLCSNDRPSTISIHYLTGVFKKRRHPSANYIYDLTKEKTMVYEYDCSKPELKRIGRYKGDSRERGFRWGERLEKEYLSGNPPPNNIQRKQKRRAYNLVKRIIYQLEESYQKENKLKEKEDYGFFIRVLKKVNVDPNQEGKQMSLIDK